MKSKNANIAVVIATCNGEKFIREQLESILIQTLMPTEIIIQDDNSQDATWEILEEYQTKYPQLIRIYLNEVGLGAHANFRKAFRYVTADYIAPCDQDDIWMPEKLERSYNALQEGGCSLVACKEVILCEDGSKVPNFYPMPSIEDCIFNHGVAGHLMMIPRSSIEVFDIADRITFDFGLTMYAACNKGGQVLDYQGCVWRRHSAVITAEYSDHNPYRLEHISKWKKMYRVLKATMSGERSKVIANREYAIHQIIVHFAKDNSKLRIYDRLAQCMMRQTPVSLLMAGIILGKIKSHTQEYKQYSLKDKIANRLFNLCAPAVFWYDYHDRDAL